MSVERAGAQWEAGIPAQSLDPIPRLAAVEQIAMPRTTPGSDVDDFRQIHSGAKVDWTQYISALNKIGVHLSTWDEIILGAAFAEFDGGSPKLIGSPPPGRWADRIARGAQS